MDVLTERIDADLAAVLREIRAEAEAFGWSGAAASLVLGALDAVLEMHELSDSRVGPPHCICQEDHSTAPEDGGGISGAWPCPTLKAISEALKSVPLL